MGWERGDSARGGAPDAQEPGGAAPIEVELVEEDVYVLADDTPDITASDTETIGGETARRGWSPWRLPQAPRTLRVLGTLAVAAALTIALWPSPNSGRHATPQTADQSAAQAAQSAQNAAQTPGSTPAPGTVNVDLYKVRVTGTSLIQDYRDHAVMGLELVNDAPARLTVVNAELWDAVQTRLGYSATWPAGDVAPGTTKSVAMELPYSCGALRTTPILPVTVRYSVSTPDDLSISHNYEYPVTPTAWDAFMQARAGLCTGPAGGVFAVSAALETPTAGYHDREGTDLVFTMDSVGRPGWTVESLSAAVPGVAVTTADLPAALSAGQASTLRTHWHFTDCVMPPQGSDGPTAVQVRTRPGDAPADGSGDQQLTVYLRPELMTRMMQASCPVRRGDPR